MAEGKFKLRGSLCDGRNGKFIVTDSGKFAVHSDCCCDDFPVGQDTGGTSCWQNLAPKYLYLTLYDVSLALSGSYGDVSYVATLNKAVVGQTWKLQQVLSGWNNTWELEPIATATITKYWNGVPCDTYQYPLKATVGHSYSGPPHSEYTLSIYIWHHFVISGPPYGGSFTTELFHYGPTANYDFRYCWNNFGIAY